MKHINKSTEQGSAAAWLQSVVQRNRRREPVGLYSVCSASVWVLEAAMRLARRTGSVSLVEATSNQVNQDGGYTGMVPTDFRERNIVGGAGPARVDRINARRGAVARGSIRRASSPSSVVTDTYTRAIRRAAIGAMMSMSRSTSADFVTIVNGCSCSASTSSTERVTFHSRSIGW